MQISRECYIYPLRLHAYCIEMGSWKVKKKIKNWNEHDVFKCKFGIHGYKCMKGCCERDITRPENKFDINQQSKMLLAITSLVNHGPKFNPLVIKVKFNICNLISHGDMSNLFWLQMESTTISLYYCHTQYCTCCDNSWLQTYNDVLRLWTWQAPWQTQNRKLGLRVTCM